MQGAVAEVEVGERQFERSLEQRMAALRRANSIRTYRAQVKSDLKRGKRSVASVIDDPVCDTMKLFDVIIAVPKYGRVKVNRIFAHNGISPSKSCGGLSDRQRDAIRDLFR